MKRIFTLIAAFACWSAAAQQQKKILFIGNSYTYTNNMPQMLVDMAATTGDQLSFEMVAPGGYTFQNHWNDNNTKSKIQQGGWHYIVLQEQSQLPAFDNPAVATQVFPFAKSLDSFAKAYNPCGRTVFFNTWGRKNGDAQNCAAWPPICTYEGMDSLLKLRYMKMAETNHAELAAVGPVWHYIRNTYPNIELYSADESHPSMAGSYAAACAFYTLILKKDPSLITYNGALPATDAEKIRSAVRTVIFNSLSEWFIGRYDPKADFDYVQHSNNTQFINQSQNASTYLWNFGNGNTANFPNPSQAYTAPGQYHVTLIVGDSCNRFDTITKTVTVNFTSIKNVNQKQYEIFPNPFTEQFFIAVGNDKITSIVISDALGRVYDLPITKQQEKIVVSTATLTKGFYFITLQSEHGKATQRLIKL